MVVRCNSGHSICHYSVNVPDSEGRKKKLVIADSCISKEQYLYYQIFEVPAQSSQELQL